ncbi:MAG: hypothetical protein QOF36_129, partial [Microbacteriaceae bacterium]|nr:hypothetical protein [Microbacteriaceae bacterium]
MSASVPAIAAVAPVLASASTSSSTSSSSNAPSGGFGAALHGAISEQSNHPGSKDGATTPGSAQGQAESGTNPAQGSSGDPVASAGALVPPAVPGASGAAANDEAEPTAQTVDPEAPALGEQKHPLPGRTPGPASAGGSGKNSKRTTGEALPAAVAQVTASLIPVPA